MRFSIESETLPKNLGRNHDGKFNGENEKVQLFTQRDGCGLP